MAERPDSTRRANCTQGTVEIRNRGRWGKLYRNKYIQDEHDPVRGNRAKLMRAKLINSVKKETANILLCLNLSVYETERCVRNAFVIKISR